TPNIKYIYQDNQGLSEARNTGIKNSNGKYIVFIQQTTNNKQQTTNNKQQTTNNKQQTPDTKYQIYISG
ncbi:glycosyltransferase family A protein, partial [Neisseria meningitidis]|uniref:glycosyltransferase family A protein n=1 Tax=Neisseria meningitidis TaxID=487 RepID=UPI001E651C7C